jgi:PAS domain
MQADVVEQRYRRLVDHSPEALAVHEGDRVVYINHAGHRYWSRATRAATVPSTRSQCVRCRSLTRSIASLRSSYRPARGEALLLAMTRRAAAVVDELDGTGAAKCRDHPASRVRRGRSGSGAVAATGAAPPPVPAPSPAAPQSPRLAVNQTWVDVVGVNPGGISAGAFAGGRDLRCLLFLQRRSGCRRRQRIWRISVR